MGSGVLMLLIAKVTDRYTAKHHAGRSSEEFTSASCFLKPGLIASGIVSAATWAVMLPQSSTVCLVYGLVGPLWYVVITQCRFGSLFAKPCLGWFSNMDCLFLFPAAYFVH
ncbi:hypothetical protein IW262DRAFT_1383462 [Armillaria fumosa]|nr:hypothetical protein IW262DRAFT_1383462 [Armillaria fumosa]